MQMMHGWPYIPGIQCAGLPYPVTNPQVLHSVTANDINGEASYKKNDRIEVCQIWRHQRL